MRALIILLLSATPAVAYDSLWCHTFSAEVVTVLRLTDTNYATATIGSLALLKTRVWAQCLNADEPPTLASYGVKLEGVVPATDDRVAACRKEYRTFRESDMTVIRRGSKGKRVPCPL